MKLEEDREERRNYILELKRKVSDLQHGSLCANICHKNVPQTGEDQQLTHFSSDTNI